MSDSEASNKPADSSAQGYTPMPYVGKKRPYAGQLCSLCTLPEETRNKVNEMLIGTPGDPHATPPVDATWITPKDISIWLLAQSPSYPISVDAIRNHQHKHLGIRRTPTKRTNFVPTIDSPPPAPVQQRAVNEQVDEPANITLPARAKGQRMGKRPTFKGPKGESTPAKVEEPRESEVVEEVQGEVVESHQSEEDAIDQLALAPRLPNTDLAYAELAVREFAKSHAKLSREIRKRPGMQMSQAEALVLVNGLPQIIQGVQGLRQINAMTKGGRFGAPEVMDQKRGLKQLLNNERAVIPGDVPPKDATPVGKPVPIQDQLAPVAQTLPVGAEGLPQAPPPPPITLSDLSAPEAPPSSPRPTTPDAAVAGALPAVEPPPIVLAKVAGDAAPGVAANFTSGTSANAPSKNDATSGAQVVNGGGAGATVTPIKRWDVVT